MDDKLYDAAVTYSKLMKKRYTIRAGRKGNAIDFSFFFDTSNFYHLVGAGKLKDIGKLNDNYNVKATLISNILEGKITYKDIASSAFIDDIGCRIDHFYEINNIISELKHGKIIIDFEPHGRSSIDADYLLFNKVNAGYCHLFLKHNCDEKYVPQSFFYGGNSNYIDNQKKYTVLDFDVSRF